MYYVYVLKSLKDGLHYTGITNNIEKRLNEHNHGKKNTPSTMNRGPFKVIYHEIVEDRAEARKREKYLKSSTGRRFLKSILIPE